MLSIKALTASQEEYYLRLCRYYAEGRGEPPGVWFGGLAFLFGLFGKVTAADLKAFMRGFRPGDPPDGAAGGFGLVQNAGGDRTGAYDLVFCAGKPYSIFWAGAYPVRQEVLAACHEAAVDYAITHIEDHYAWCRTGKQGKGKAVKADIAVAKFQHSMSRANDPLLHTHCLIQNVGIDEHGKTRALDGHVLFEAKMFLGALYRAELAHRARKDASLKVKYAPDGFTIPEVPEELQDIWSSRAKQIKAEAERLGYSSARAKAVVALDTREKKSIEDRSEFFARIRELNSSYGLTPEKIEKACKQRPWRVTPKQKKTMKVACELQLLASKNTFTEMQAKTQMLCLGVGCQASPGQLLKLAEEFLASKHIVPLENGRFTTKAVLAQEAKLLRLAESVSEKKGLYVPTHVIEEHQESLPESERLDDEQFAAAKYLLQADTALRILTGFAGTGKSRIFEFLNEVIEKQSSPLLKNPLVFATPTNQSTKVLEAEGLSAGTVAAHLARTRPERLMETIGRVAIDEILKGKKPRRRKKPVKLTERSIFALDEAGNVGLADFVSILERVDKGNATLILAGDPTQNPPVGGVSPLFSLARRYGSSELTTIYRQWKNPWYQKLATELTQGSVTKTFAILKEQMRLHAFDTVGDALAQACISWARTGVHEPTEAVVLVNTNKDVRRANALCQDLSKQAGVLSKERIKISDTEQQSGKTYTTYAHVGDCVEITENSKFRKARRKKLKLTLRKKRAKRPLRPLGWKRNPTTWGYGVTNRDRGTIVAIRGDNIVVRIASKQEPSGKLAKALLEPNERVINTKKFKHIRLAYAGTSNSWQGSSIKIAHCVLGGEMTTFPTTMVKVTRGTEDCHVYTSKALLERPEDGQPNELELLLAKRPDLTLASDHLPGQTIVYKPPSARPYVDPATLVDEGKQQAAIQACDEREEQRQMALRRDTSFKKWLKTVPANDAEHRKRLIEEVSARIKTHKERRSTIDDFLEKAKKQGTKDTPTPLPAAYQGEPPYKEVPAAIASLSESNSQPDLPQALPLAEHKLPSKETIAGKVESAKAATERQKAALLSEEQREAKEKQERHKQDIEAGYQRLRDDLEAAKRIAKRHRLEAERLEREQQRPEKGASANSQRTAAESSPTQSQEPSTKRLRLERQMSEAQRLELETRAEAARNAKARKLERQRQELQAANQKKLKHLKKLAAVSVDLNSNDGVLNRFWIKTHLNDRLYIAKQKMLADQLHVYYKHDPLHHHIVTMWLREKEKRGWITVSYKEGFACGVELTQKTRDFANGVFYDKPSKTEQEHRAYAKATRLMRTSNLFNQAEFDAIFDEVYEKLQHLYYYSRLGQFEEILHNCINTKGAYHYAAMDFLLIKHWYDWIKVDLTFGCYRSWKTTRKCDKHFAKCKRIEEERWQREQEELREVARRVAEHRERQARQQAEQAMQHGVPSWQQTSYVPNNASSVYPTVPSYTPAAASTQPQPAYSDWQAAAGSAAMQAFMASAQSSMPVAVSPPVQATQSIVIAGTPNSW